MPAQSLLIERFKVAVDLWETGVMLQRQRLRREHPTASEQQIEAIVTHWLQERPGAERGDGPPPSPPHVAG